MTVHARDYSGAGGRGHCAKSREGATSVWRFLRQQGYAIILGDTIAGQGQPIIVWESHGVVMYAETIAVGPFSKDLIEHLEYSEGHYKDTKEGTIITQTLFGLVEGTSVGMEFASCLGITDAWDFNQHKIDNEKIDLEALKEFVGRYKDYEEDFRKLTALKAKGFEFHFVPNF